MIVATEELAAHRGRVAMVDGGFDPLHAGHLEYFFEAAKLGAPVLCNVASDEYVSRKHPPLLAQDQRGRLIDALRPIAYTHLSRSTTEDVLRELRPRYYVKGIDWRGRLPEEQLRICREAGTEIVFLDTIRHSSTALLAAHLDARASAESAVAAPRAAPFPRAVPSHAEEPVRAGTAPPAVDAVVGHHLDPFRSGVARFNQILAERLAVPVLGLFDQGIEASRAPLFSFKASELPGEEVERLTRLLEAGSPQGMQLFLHEWRDLPLEQALVKRAKLVWCGNHEVLERARPLAREARLAWAPGLISDTRPFSAVELSVFSFGMAHKVRTDMFARLAELLEESGRTYALYMSNANHETTTLEDAQLVFEAMRRVFPRELYFLGNLSDVAVSNTLSRTTFFAAFFEKGVRANNTSVASAMEHGAVVITNLDAHSPTHLRHMDNVIDLGRGEPLPDDPDTLAGIGARAAETARAFGWERLVAELRGAPGA